MCGSEVVNYLKNIPSNSFYHMSSVEKINPFREQGKLKYITTKKNCITMDMIYSKN